ncbi:MAG: DNA (cytosine-5-)-methyltransferase [Cyanobacteria bacterium J06555_12]
MVCFSFAFKSKEAVKGKIQIVDLFAGPGGLGEGFASFKHRRMARPFHIAMSVEKEPNAHKTLELRAFFRQFRTPPDDYYNYIRGAIGREELFCRYSSQAERAREETLYGPRELGPGAGHDELIYERLSAVVRGAGAEAPKVVIGGPPCQAYSLVGRARNRGVRGYKAEQDRRHFLYEEYLKVLHTARPAVFVMENVKGILSSRVNGKHIFPRLVEDLHCPDASLRKKVLRTSRYRIFSLVNGTELNELSGTGRDCVIRSEDFGVPQARHRVILLGVREDISAVPGTLSAHGKKVVSGEILDDLPKLRSGLSKAPDSASAWESALKRQAARVAIELKKHGLDPRAATDAAKASTRRKNRGGRFVHSRKKYGGPEHLAQWIPDPRLRGLPNHETRGHMESDLARYLYCSCYAQQSGGASPRSHGFPEVFAPNHASWESGKFADRFKVQSRDRPASTITSHISKDGHYFIHYDSSQCRSLTVREAARLQTFPDNYFFEGGRTQQYVQVGNAVPPWLARQIAAIVYELVA